MRAMAVCSSVSLLVIPNNGAHMFHVSRVTVDHLHSTHTGKMKATLKDWVWKRLIILKQLKDQGVNAAKYDAGSKDEL